MSNPYQKGRSTYNGFGVGIQAPVGQQGPTQVPPPVHRALNPGHPNGAVTRRHFDVERTIEAGGDLGSQMLVKAISPFERLYRREPEEGMFFTGVSRTTPFSFDMGAFRIPQRMTLLIYNFRPDIYRFSGVDPGDYLPIESRRLSSIVQWELKIDEQFPGNVDFQNEPAPITNQDSAGFESNNMNLPTAAGSQFQVQRVQTLADGAGSENSLLPQRPDRFGAPSPVPFTLYAQSNQIVRARCIVSNPIPTPIAFFEFSITGVLVPDTWFNNMQEALKYPQNIRDESIR